MFRFFKKYHLYDYKTELEGVDDFTLFALVKYIIFEILYRYGATKQLTEPCPGIDFSITLKNQNGKSFNITLKDLPILPMRQIFLIHYDVQVRMLFSEPELAEEYLTFVTKRFDDINNTKKKFSKQDAPLFYAQLIKKDIPWPETKAYLASFLFYDSKIFKENYPELHNLLKEYHETRNTFERSF